MKRSETPVRIVRHTINHGGPLFLWRVQHGDGSAEGTLVTSTICLNPECPCQEITLLGRPLERESTGRCYVGEGVSFRAVLDLSTGGLAPLKGREGEPIPDWIRNALTIERVDELRELRDRTRRQQQRDRWRELPRRELDRMVSGELTAHFEVFPDDWDMVIGREGQPYWVVDNYCLNPSCSCRDVLLQFKSANTRLYVGSARVEIGNWGHPMLEGRSDMPSYWKQFIGEKGRKQALKKRYREMRGVAAALGEFLHRAESPVSPSSNRSR
jgi:hypothetical protein